jgi:hypothetical protein
MKGEKCSVWVVVVSAVLLTAGLAPGWGEDDGCGIRKVFDF